MPPDRLLDQRFLTTHPETEAWWARREKCQGCHNLIGESQLSRGSDGMRCRAAPARVSWQPKAEYSYCIDARSEGPCGPSALLWQPIRLTALVEP